MTSSPYVGHIATVEGSSPRRTRPGGRRRIRASRTEGSGGGTTSPGAPHRTPSSSSRPSTVDDSAIVSAASCRCTGLVSEFNGLTEITVTSARRLHRRRRAGQHRPPRSPTPGRRPMRPGDASSRCCSTRPARTPSATPSPPTSTARSGSRSARRRCATPTDAARARAQPPRRSPPLNAARAVTLDDGATTNFLASSGGVLVNGDLIPPYVDR